MKRNFIPLILLVSTIFGMSSCFSDTESEIILTDEVGITAFSVGTQKIIRDTVTSKGADSTYQSTIDCSGYIFRINQTTHEIYNPDSLPVGIDAKKIICSLTTKSDATALIKNVDSDTINLFSSVDSIDFSSPRTLRIISLSGRASVDYTVKINIHTQKPNVFKWNQATENQDIAGLSGFRAFALGGKIYVMGCEGNTPRIFVANEGNTVEWNEIDIAANLGAGFYKSVAIMGNSFYTYAEDGFVYSSNDGSNWNKVAPATIERILGASNKMLYAISSDKKIMASADGTTWAEQQLDASAELLPTDNYSIIARPLSTNQAANRVVLAGTATTASRIWSYIEETDPTSEPQPWTYLNVASDNRFTLPCMKNLQVTYYDNFMMATGGIEAEDGQTTVSPSFYTSVDGGMTWRTRALYDLPEEFSSEGDRFAFVKDSQNYLWMIESTGKVWRGRLNRLGWQTEQTYFGQQN